MRLQEQGKTEQARKDLGKQQLFSLVSSYVSKWAYWWTYPVCVQIAWLWFANREKRLPRSVKRKKLVKTFEILFALLLFENRKFPHVSDLLMSLFIAARDAKKVDARKWEVITLKKPTYYSSKKEVLLLLCSFSIDKKIKTFAIYSGSCGSLDLITFFFYLFY